MDKCYREEIEDNFDIKASYVKWDHTMDIDAENMKNALAKEYGLEVHI